MKDIMRRTFTTTGGDTFDDVVREARAYLDGVPALLDVNVAITVEFPGRLNVRETMPPRRGRKRADDNGASDDNRRDDRASDPQG